MNKKQRKSPSRSAKKNPNIMQTYTALYNLYREPKDEKSQNILADELLDWSFRDDSIRLEQFAFLKQITPSRLYRIAEGNEYFSAKLDQVKVNLANRIWDFGIRELIPQHVFVRLLPLYSKEFKEYERERTKTAVEARYGSQGAHIKVVMEKFTSEEVHENT